MLAQTRPAHTILVLGDSISAGFGLPQGSGWVNLLQQRLAAQHLDYSVDNASISGDTTAGGRARLPELLARLHPTVVIIELGGNDGLRGLPIALMQKNLDALVHMSEEAHARVLLIGMELPPNYGPQYTQQFAAAFGEVARHDGVAFVPFFFQGFADRLELFQADRIHPTVAAQPRLLDTVWPALRPLLR